MRPIYLTRAGRLLDRAVQRATWLIGLAMVVLGVVLMLVGAGVLAAGVMLP